MRMNRSTAIARRTGNPNLAEQIVQPAEVVEQLALDVAPRERLMEVLPVDVDEMLADRLELLDRNGSSVDEGARAAVRIDDATDQTLVAFIE